MDNFDVDFCDNSRRQAASEDSIEAAVDSLKVSEDEAKEVRFFDAISTLI